MGTEETLAPSMARQTAGNNLKHTLRVGVPCRDGTACHAQQTLSSHNTLWDADSERIDTDQSSRQGPHDENPTVPPSCVHPAGKSTVPSSSYVAPSVDASLDRGVGLAPGLLVSTFADENSRCNGFGLDSRYSSATRVPSDESDTTPRDCSGHFTSCDATGGEASPTKLLPFPGVPSSSGNESHFQRRCRSRRRVRARNFWTRNVEPCLSDHEGGAKEVQCTKGRRTCIQLVASHRIHGNSELIRGSAVGRTPCIENRRKLSNDINTHGVTDENSSFEVSSATFSGKQARSLQQIVPAQSQLNPSSVSNLNVYSGTSDKGHCIKDTFQCTNLYSGNTFLPLKEDNLSIMDKMIHPNVSLFRGSTIHNVHSCYLTHSRSKRNYANHIYTN